MELQKVVVLDEKTLRLDEVGNIGDTINLEKLKLIDDSLLRKLIEDKKDKVYEEKLNNLKNSLLSEKEKEILLLKEKNDHAIDVLKAELASQNNKIQENLKTRISELETKEKESERNLDSIKEGYRKDKELEVAMIKEECAKSYSDILLDLKTKNASLETKIIDTEDIVRKETELKAKTEVNKLQNELRTAESTLAQLKLDKSVFGIKLLGEHLENWCSKEFDNYVTSGFANCTFIKDNELVQSDINDKKTKADYIFRSYFDDEKKVEIVSVCCDMKSENSESKTKQHNNVFYEKLNKDRIKKNCMYALLISELDYNTENDVPIFKVREFEDMYVVRPQYFMTFLDIVYAIGEKYHTLEMQLEKNKITYKNKLELKAEFDKMKINYLESPISMIAKQVEEIKKNSIIIQEANSKIIDKCDNFIDNKLDEMRLKIEKFNIEKIYRQFEINEESKKEDDDEIDQIDIGLE